MRNNFEQLVIEGTTVRKEKEVDIVKERAMQYGMESLFNNEALSLLTGIKAEELKGKSLSEIREQIPMLNITENQRLKLEAFFEMAVRFSKEERGQSKSVKCPQDAFNLVVDEMRDLKKEQFKIIMLDTKSRLIDVKLISEGSLNSSIVHPREVFKEAILNSSASVILIHNHPSNDVTESNEDVGITRRLCDCGRALGIEVVDHLIIGGNRFKSLKEAGLF